MFQSIKETRPIYASSEVNLLISSRVEPPIQDFNAQLPNHDIETQIAMDPTFAQL